MGYFKLCKMIISMGVVFFGVCVCVCGLPHACVHALGDVTTVLSLGFFFFFQSCSSTNRPAQSGQWMREPTLVPELMMELL